MIYLDQAIILTTQIIKLRINNSIFRLPFLLLPSLLALSPANFSVNYLVNAAMVFATLQIIMLNADLMEAIVATTFKMVGIPDAIVNGIRT